MKQGKVSESILKRTVIKTIKYRSDSIIAKAAPGNDAAVACYGEESQLVMSNAVGGLYGSEEHLQYYMKLALYRAINNVYAKGGIPDAVILSVTMPTGKLESDLRNLMGALTKLCAARKLEIAGGSTEVSKKVVSPVVNFTVIGKRNPNQWQETPACAGMDIVMTKQIGLMGTSILTVEQEAKLRERFVASYVKLGMDTEQDLLIDREAQIAKCPGTACMHDVSRGGIFAALWELAGMTGCGVEAEINRIPVRQETIEFCELFDLNPYKMISQGALLIVTKQGESLVADLEKEGIAAAVIGRLTDSNDKVVIQNEERRYIEPPKTDEIYKVI